MKKIILFYILSLQVVFLFSETAVVKKILFLPFRTYDFISNDYLFLRKTVFFPDDAMYKKHEEQLYVLNLKKNSFSFIFENKEIYASYCRLKSENKVAYGIAKELETSRPYSPVYKNSYEINMEDLSISKEIDDNFDWETFKEVPDLIKNFYKYPMSEVRLVNAWPELGNYYFVNYDLHNRQPVIDKLYSPLYPKHIYEDQDVCCLNEKGRICGVFPFTLDDQQNIWIKLISSDDKKTILIDAPTSKDFRNIDVRLSGAFNIRAVYLYELIDDEQVPDYQTEVLDLTRLDNIKEKKEYKITPAYVDATAMAVKIANLSLNAILNDSRVRLRSAPNLSCDTLSYLNKGDAVKITDRSDDTFTIDGESWYWYKVTITDSKTGWVYGKYLDIE